MLIDNHFCHSLRHLSKEPPPLATTNPPLVQRNEAAEIFQLLRATKNGTSEWPIIINTWKAIIEEMTTAFLLRMMITSAFFPF
jgi:hypothetical protein